MPVSMKAGISTTAATERLFETIKGKGVAVVKSEGMMNPPAPPSPVLVLIIIPR